MRRGRRWCLAATLLAALPGAALAGPEGAAGRAFPPECVPFSDSGLRTSVTCGATLIDGRAVAPPYAPPPVRRVIAFANHIRGRRYVWGGGHRRWRTTGYDCSGAVSFALHGADLVERTMVSGELAYWGHGGRGHWITVYANREHVYMEVAGLRFDTRDDLPGVTGPRWHTGLANPRRFAVRHPAGL